MHFEPIFKEGVVTVDNVRTVKAFEHALKVIKDFQEKHIDLEERYEQQELLVESLRQEMEELYKNNTRDSVKIGEKFIYKSNSSDFYYLTTKAKLPSKELCNILSSNFVLLNLIDPFGWDTSISEINSYLQIAKQAIHAFSVTVQQACWISWCENLSVDFLYRGAEEKLEFNKERIDSLVRELEAMKSHFPSKAVFTHESVSKEEEDTRSVFQWLKDVWKGN